MYRSSCVNAPQRGRTSNQAYDKTNSRTQRMSLWRHEHYCIHTGLMKVSTFKRDVPLDFNFLAGRLINTTTACLCLDVCVQGLVVFSLLT